MPQVIGWSKRRHKETCKEWLLLPLGAQEIFGSSLPEHWSSWLGWLVGIWGGFGILQVSVEAFFKGWGKKDGVLVRPSGYILWSRCLGWVLGKQPGILVWRQLFGPIPVVDFGGSRCR
jgi:hypothetical protein